MAAARKYNFIYKKLYEKPNDLIGLLAYGRYKEKKIEFIEDFEKRTSNKPTDDDFEEFHRLSALHINDYREGAERQLAEIVERIIQGRMDEFSQKQEEIQKDVLKTLKPSFWRLSMAGIVGGFSYSVFLILAVLAIAGGQVNIIDMVLKGLGVNIK